MLNHLRSGSGEVVVLQHGLLGGGRYWLPQVAYLQRFFDVVAPDLPGFAGSGSAPVPDTIEGFADALLAFLDAEAIRKFSLVGHSMGGMIAQHIAIHHPDRLDRLVLFGTAASGDLPGRFETLEQSLTRLERDGIERFARDLAATWFVAGRQSPYYEFCVECGKGATAQAAAAAMQAVLKWKAGPRVADIGAKTLAICGDSDRGTVPAMSFALWQAIRGARLAIVPACSHNAHLDNPEIFNRIVGDFLLGAA
jgi:pimeloyl-ACP methyl ester carboxylesterase